MIILGDIHGRGFWKKAIEGRETEEIIFLGDYLDPYPQEWGTDVELEAADMDRWTCIRNASIENFKEIIEFKKTHMNNVTLLLGNHDCGYMVSTDVCSCRSDRLNYSEIKEIFRENKDLFKMAMYKEINGKQFLFTHAGLTRQWFKANFPEANADDCTRFADHLNNQYEVYMSDNEQIVVYGYCIGQVSYYRGGYDPYSSFIWTDIREYYNLSLKDDMGMYQIFAHTRLSEPFVTDKFAMLDAQRGFILTDEGILTELDGTPVPVKKLKEEDADVD